MKPFWCVWNENNRNPIVKHDTPDEAEQEATRIAIREGCPIHVLELRATCYPVVRWEYPACAICNQAICVCEYFTNEATDIKPTENNCDNGTKVASCVGCEEANLCR